MAKRAAAVRPLPAGITKAYCQVPVKGGSMLSRLVTLSCLCALFLVSEVRAQSANAAQLQGDSREGEKALTEGRYAEAAEAYEKLGQLAPNTAGVHARLGLIYFQQGRFEQAVSALRQAIKLKTTLPNTDLLLAMALSELGQYREALTALEKGFKLATDTALKRASGLQLQRAYTGLQQDDKAVAVALELTKLYPKNLEVLYHTGRWFANYAYLSTMKLAEVAPDSLWLHLAAGEANESQGQFRCGHTGIQRSALACPQSSGCPFPSGTGAARGRTTVHNRCEFRGRGAKGVRGGITT
jgi:tetratricopeptide (TPR) repeat protein